MEDKGKLPEGWKIVVLGEVCKLKNGFAFKSSEYSKSGTPIVRISDINGGVVSTADSVRIRKSHEYSEYTISKGDILVAMSGATTGKFGVYLNNEPAYQNQRVGNFKITDSSLLDAKFLLYQIYSLRRTIEKDAYGGAQPNISSKKIENMKITLAPRKEQQQIVSKIEELFSELDKGIENLKTARQQLKVYRQSVLKWAFEGKLTNDNVKDGELPEGWKWVKLSDACNKIQDGSHFSPQRQYLVRGENQFPYITAKNIRHNYMDLSKVVYVDQDFHESIYKRCNPEFGDVLLTKDGVNTGEVTLNNLKEPFSLLSSVCLFKTRIEYLLPAFLKHYIQSPIGHKNLIGEMSGTAIKRIVLKKIKTTEIVLPPAAEQMRILDEIESRLSVADKLEETIAKSLQQAEALRQSILKRAFEGKLVTKTGNEYTLVRAESIM